MLEIDNWCGVCNRNQQAAKGNVCTYCGMKVVGWNDRVQSRPPRKLWNTINGFSPEFTHGQAIATSHFRQVNDAFTAQNRKAYEQSQSNLTSGGFMSTQARFDPDQVEAFSIKLKMYIRTLEDYDSQVTNALTRLGDTFDDEDYRDLCTEFDRTKALLRTMVEAAQLEIPRIENMCADVRANQAVRVGG